MDIILTANDGRDIPLNGKKTVIGRESDCDIMVDVSVVSRRHVTISSEDGAVYITDLGSANGTTVNGEKLLPNCKRQLRSGDKVVLATKVSFTVTLKNDGGETSILSRPMPADDGRGMNAAADAPTPTPAPISAPVRVQTPTPVPVSPAAPAEPPTMAKAPDRMPRPAPVRKEQPKKKKKLLIPVLAAVVLLAVAACVLLLGKPAATKNAEALIDAIGTVTLESRDAVLEARAAYDKLTEKELKKLENGDKLTAAEAAMRKCGWDDAVKKIGGEWKSILTPYDPEKKGLMLVSEKTFEGKFSSPDGSGTWTLNGGEEHWKEADKLILDLGDLTLELKKEGSYDILFDSKNEDAYVRAGEYEKYYGEHFKIVELSEDNVKDVLQYSLAPVKTCSDSPKYEDYYDLFKNGEVHFDTVEIHVTTSKLYDEGWILVSEKDIFYWSFIMSTAKTGFEEQTELGVIENTSLFCQLAFMNVSNDVGSVKQIPVGFMKPAGTAVFVNKKFVDRVEYDDDSNSHTVYMTNGASFRIECEYHTENFREY